MFPASVSHGKSVPWLWVEYGRAEIPCCNSHFSVTSSQDDQWVKMLHLGLYTLISFIHYTPDLIHSLHPFASPWPVQQMEKDNSSPQSCLFIVASLLSTSRLPDWVFISLCPFYIPGGVTFTLKTICTRWYLPRDRGWQRSPVHILSCDCDYYLKFWVTLGLRVCLSASLNEFSSQTSDCWPRHTLTWTCTGCSCWSGQEKEELWLMGESPSQSLPQVQRPQMGQRIAGLGVRAGTPHSWRVMEERRLS